MALKGVREPVQGVKGAKGPTRLREPKVPRQPETETSVKLGEQYLRERNAQMRAKRLRAEMELAASRGELIEKELVLRQMAYCLIAFRQSVLAWPGKLRASIGVEFTDEMAQKARGLAIETLEHLEKLPECVESDWLENLPEEES
jgi:hypothetical protein